jgi:PadR family transcriptional regulator, regulatory protein PadR
MACSPPEIRVGSSARLPSETLAVPDSFTNDASSQAPGRRDVRHLRASKIFDRVGDMNSRSLGEFELAVLLCVGLLRDDAYGVAVRGAVSKRLGRDCSIGAVYTTLQRLENKGFVKSWMSDPTPVRGGRAKRYFALTAAGDRAIRQAQATAQRLWSRSGLRLSNT